jgi:hypothetical protein
MEENKKMKAFAKHRRCMKSKGDRLGWMLRSEVKYLSLREIAEYGKIVDDSCCFISATLRMIM